MNSQAVLAENSKLKTEIETLKVQNSELHKQLSWLIEQLKLGKKREFGASSEKSEYDFAQLMIFNEAEYFAKPEIVEPKIAIIKEHRRKTRLTTDKLPPDIPIEIVEHTLCESEKVCPECDDPLHRIGKEKVRDELKIIPAKAIVVQHVRHSYGCRKCEMEAEVPTIIKAPTPAPVIKGSFASAESVAHVMVQKFVMGTPLYRQEKEFERNGVLLSRQTMSNWLIKATEDWLEPVYNLLHKQLLGRELLLADETEFQVLKEPGRSAQQKSYLWVYRTGNDGLPPIVLSEYQPGRGREHPKKFLSNYSGYLHTDGWEAYHKLPEVTIVGCWAHARRKFDEALKTLAPKDREGTNAHRGKQYCDRLFETERRLADLTADERFKQRLKFAQPLLDEFHAWLSSFKDLGKSAFCRAVKYSLDQWKYLKNYMLDGRLEISNNRTERTIKRFVIDRKNFLFANTPRGAHASAVIFSIIETALENNLNPFDYLVYIFKNAPNWNISQNPIIVEQLLPNTYRDSIAN